MTTLPAPQWLTLREAIAITRHPTIKAFTTWRRRLEAKHPELTISRRPGYISDPSLRTLLRLAASHKPP